MVRKLSPDLIGDLNTFTGAIIPDGSNIKEAFQAVESELTSKLKETDLSAQTSGKGGAKVGMSHDISRVPATAIDRFKRQLFVTDAPFFADSGNIDDMSLAFKAAWDYGIANGFGELVLPGGEFKWLTAVTCDNSTDTSPLGRRMSIVGSGQRGSIIKMSGAAYTALTLIGSNSPGAADAQISIEKMYFDQNSKQGTCLSIQRYSHMSMKDVRCNGSFRAIDMTDVQESKLDNVVVGFANYGLRLQPGLFTSPNNMSLIHCKMGNCDFGGAEFINAAQINIFGGSYEGNHPGMGPYDPNRIGWGIKAEWNAAANIEGTVGMNVIGAYIEANGMPIDSTTPTADVLLVNKDSSGNCVAPMVNNFIGNTFQRHDEFYCTNNILFDTGPSPSGQDYKHTLNLFGNGHQGFYGYVPATSKKYVHVTRPQDVYIDDRGCRYVDPVERPDWTAYNNTSHESHAQAWVRFNGAGATGSKTAQALQNVAYINKVSTGVYQITLARPLASAFNVYNVGLIGGFGVWSVTAETETVITLETRAIDATTPADFQIGFSVFGKPLV